MRYIAKYGGAKVQPVEYLEMDYDTFYSYDYYGGGESDYADHLVDPPNGENTEAVVKGQGKYQYPGPKTWHIDAPSLGTLG